MKRFAAIPLLCTCICVSVLPVHALQGMLEKKMHYITAADKQVDTVSYWAMYLGNYEVTIERKFPGKPKEPVDASFNFNLLSNGYIEGKGYCEEGKIQAEADFKVVVDSANQRTFSPEEILYVYDYGRKVKLSDGTMGNLYIAFDGVKEIIKKLQLRIYRFQKQYGEEMLKEDHDDTDIILYGFSFSEQGINKAIKTIQK